MLRRPLKDVTTYFDDATFYGLSFKRYSINFTTKGGASWWFSPVNPITNSSRLNLQIISTNYCYQLLFKIVTEVRNRIIPGFGEDLDKRILMNLLVIDFLKPQNILKITFSVLPEYIIFWTSVTPIIYIIWHDHIVPLYDSYICGRRVDPDLLKFHILRQIPFPLGVGIGFNFNLLHRWGCSGWNGSVNYYPPPPWSNTFWLPIDLLFRDISVPLSSTNWMAQ